MRWDWIEHTIVVYSVWRFPNKDTDRTHDLQIYSVSPSSITDIDRTHPLLSKIEIEHTIFLYSYNQSDTLPTKIQIEHTTFLYSVWHSANKDIVRTHDLQRSSKIFSVMLFHQRYISNTRPYTYWHVEIAIVKSDWNNDETARKEMGRIEDDNP